MGQKNLLFIFADQWRASALGYAKEDPVITPNMDKFCGESVYCRNAYSTFPLCSPHRASLLTGRYPLSTGVFTNCKTGLGMRLKDEEHAMGQVLKQHGYHTAYIGKWHLDEPEENHEKTPTSGAKAWDAFTPLGVRRHGFDFWYSYGAWDAHLEPHYWRDNPQMIQIRQWSPEHETDVAIDYIREHNEEPFALYLSWNPPHSPYGEVPEKYCQMYQDIPLRDNVSMESIHHHTGEQVPCTEEKLREITKQYYGAITGLDEQFGRLVAELKQLGIYEDTVVVLSADHGDMMFSHGMLGKHVWYEESIHIPLVLRFPGGSVRICDTCIGSQDIMPTLLGVLGLPVPDTVEGVDCSQSVLGERENPEKPCFLCACPGRNVFLEEFEHAGKDPAEAGWRGIRTGRYTYVVDTGYGSVAKLQRHLYDNESDHFQKKELDLDLLEHRTLANQLEAMVISWTKEYGDNFRGFMED